MLTKQFLETTRVMLHSIVARNKTKAFTARYAAAVNGGLSFPAIVSLQTKRRVRCHEMTSRKWRDTTTTITDEPYVRRIV